MTGPAPTGGPTQNEVNEAKEAKDVEEEQIPGLRLTGKRLRDLGTPFHRSMGVTALLGLAVTATRVVQALLIAVIFGHVLHRHGAIAPAAAGIAVATAARLVLIWWRNRQATATATVVDETLRAQLWGRLSELGPGYLVRHRTGAVETAVVDGVDRLAGYYGEFVPLALASIVSVVALLAWITVLDPLTGLAMVAAAVLVPAAPVLTARAFGEAGLRFSQGLARLASEYLDAIQGLVTLKAFNASDAWGHRLAERCEDLSADATSLGGLSNMHVGFVSLAMAAGTLLGVALATLRVTHHALAGSALIAILLLARECFRPLGELQAAFPSAYQAVAAANGVVDILDAPVEVPEPAAPTPLDRATLRASVAFDEVVFSYRPDQPDRAPALAGVSFVVSPGETVALVGPSGAGKTTLVSLLLRFFDPQEGVIRLGGHDVRDLSRTDLRSLVSVTFQDTYLFHRSVLANLLLARPDATRADVEAAARAATAHEFIVALPDGYDTVVGERGTRLSGGERQRLAIARALLADTPILVLDEPTSSVDAASEALITDAIERLTAERTTIVIAHRLSTIRRADRVVVLDRGRVVEVGTPTELRGNNGVFARLVEAQELSS
jgi:ATP-binding cassette, subfamily C, bacterial CydD